jgi:hypothetical protein
VGRRLGASAGSRPARQLRVKRLAQQDNAGAFSNHVPQTKLVRTTWSPWPIAVLAAVALTLFIAPVGFVGGGWDDWQYLNAARCWRELGPCLPNNHWQGRWPVFGPIAVLTALFGESRWTVSLWPLVASLGCLALLAEIGKRTLGHPAGWIASLLFVLTPAFSLQLLTPRAEAIELLFILGGTLVFVVWTGGRRTWQAALSGLLFSLAIQVRETAVIAVAFAALYTLTMKPRAGWREVGAATAAFIVPFAIEFLTFALATGDPLYRRTVSIGHTLLVSSELRGPTTPGHAPFFNSNYIMNWRHEPGIHVHWAVDGFLNLFVNLKVGISLVASTALYFFGALFLTAADRRKMIFLLLIALGYCLLLIYALAVDPKARMMLVPLCATCLAVAIGLSRLIEVGRSALVCAIVFAAAIIDLVVLVPFRSTTKPEEAARRWMAQYPGDIEIDGNSRRHLTLLAGARLLPNVGSGRPYWIYHGVTSCSRFISESGLQSSSIEVADEIPISRLARFNPEWSPAICLFRYRKHLSEVDIHYGILRARRDGLFVLMPRDSVLEPD